MPGSSPFSRLLYAPAKGKSNQSVGRRFEFHPHIVCYIAIEETYFRHHSRIKVLL